MEDTKLLQLDNVTCTERVIGQGAYGRVMEVSTLCAAKEIHIALVDFSSPQGFTTLKQKFLQECAQCMVLCHPNIVHFQGIYYPSKSIQLPWLVMERMDCSLRQYLESYEPTAVSFQIKLSILHDVSLGLQYLHAQDIIHRDLSSNNVLLNKQLVAKIADLGVAKMIDPNHARSATRAPGTVIFMPPEALLVTSRYGKPVDVFSFGCVAIHTMTHIWPVPKDEVHVDEATSKKSVLSEVQRRDSYLANIHEPFQLKELILQCLQDSPKYRPSVNDVCKTLQEVQPDLKISKIQSILLDHEPLLGEKEKLTKELDRLNNELAAANESIDRYKHLHQQQADSYQSDLCKAEELKNAKSMTPDTEKVKAACSEGRIQSVDAKPKVQLYTLLTEDGNYSDVIRGGIFTEPQGTVQVDNSASKGQTSRGNLTSKDLVKVLDDDDLVVDDPDMFIAKHDFTPIGPGQLAFKKGDKIHVKRYNDAQDWCEGETDSGVIGWTPTAYLVKPNDLENHLWYHGLVTREEAEHRLCTSISGIFLIRESESRPGQYSMSLRYNGLTHHYKISDGDGGGYYYITPDAKFTTLQLLVQHHSNHSDGLITTLQYPAVNPTKPPVYSLSHEVDKWEKEKQDLVIGAKLGTGQYSEVHKAIFKPMGKTVAVKTFKEDTISVEQFLKEASLMKDMKHPHLVQLFGVCTRRIPFFIITEFMEKGNLLYFIQGPEGADLQPVTLMHMGKQIADGMAYLEKLNIIHRDLAARNCLVGKYHFVKIAGFGMSHLLDAAAYDTSVDTKIPIKWTAPEALMNNKFSTKSDVWSFGILLWELTTRGMSPYPNVELSQMYEVLAKGYRLDCPNGCPENIYSVMRKCWSWKESDRPMFSALYQELCQLSNISTDLPGSTVVQLEPSLWMSQNKDKISQIPPQTSRVPLPPDQSRKTKHNFAASSFGNSMLQDSTDFDTLQPISDNPSHIVEEIAIISANLLDISLKGFTEFKRSLEYFAQLSKKMLHFMQTQNTTHLASVSMLTEKIEDFRNLLTQIDSNPSHEYNSQIETFVNDISKSCRDLYDKLYSSK